MEQIKTVEEIEDIFRVAVFMIWNSNPEEKRNQKRIRFPWGSDIKNKQSDTTPTWKREEDVCFIYELPQDGSYNGLSDITYEIDESKRDFIEVDEHTDIHTVLFANYGPNAYECARDIRDGFKRERIREYLKGHHFFVVPPIAAIRRVPELINGQWWNRVDVTIVFNEYVRREEPIQSIESVTVTAMAVTNNGKELKKSVKSEIR